MAWGTTWIEEAGPVPEKAWEEAANKAMDKASGVPWPTKVNKVPTHDIYKNPDTHIYYECSCGAILDPGTKSFAALNNCASKEGWKIRFGETGYTPYCVKCGEGIE